MIFFKPGKYEAVKALVGGVLSQIADGTIVYHDGQKPPTKAEIDNKLTELEAEWNTLQYQRDRTYPELGEQFDLLYRDMTDGKGDKTGEWYKAVSKVKADFPKPA